jgi:hypothetical protein
MFLLHRAVPPVKKKALPPYVGIIPFGRACLADGGRPRRGFTGSLAGINKCSKFCKQSSPQNWKYINVFAPKLPNKAKNHNITEYSTRRQAGLSTCIRFQRK